MTDKTQLEAIADILKKYARDVFPARTSCLPVDRRSVSQQILDLCQPKWIYVSERLPDAEPHRNIEIAYVDAAGQRFSGQVSSWIIHAVDCYAWREVELPEPPGESE